MRGHDGEGMLECYWEDLTLPVFCAPLLEAVCSKRLQRRDPELIGGNINLGVSVSPKIVASGSLLSRRPVRVGMILKRLQMAT